MSYILRRRRLGFTSCKGISEVSTTGIGVIRNDTDLPPADFIFRWGCTSNVPHGCKIVNKASAIHLVGNKTAFRKMLNDKGLCPETWWSVEEGIRDNCFPCIVRPAVHAQGKNVLLATDEQELRAAAAKCGEGYYISRYIKKVAEYRVFVAQGRAVWVAQKTPGNPEDIAWNVAKGGRFDNVRWGDWPLKAVKIAIQGFALSGLDFGGVDVMVDADNNCYILEINSAPSQTSPYRQSCVAKVFDYMVEKGLDTIPLVEERGGYRKFIHPAVSGDAILKGV